MWLLPQDMVRRRLAFPFFILLYIVVFFVATCLVEFLYAWRMVRKRRVQVGWATILNGVFLANLASYAILGPVYYCIEYLKTDIHELTAVAPWVNESVLNVEPGCNLVLGENQAAPSFPMTYKKTLNQIRKLLDEGESVKTDKERIAKLVLVKILIEEALEQLKKQSDKQQAAYAAKTRIIKQALRQFLSALDKIYAKHEELGDTDVREQIDPGDSQGLHTAARRLQLAGEIRDVQ